MNEFVDLSQDGCTRTDVLLGKSSPDSCGFVALGEGE